MNISPQKGGERECHTYTRKQLPRQPVEIGPYSRDRDRGNNTVGIVFVLLIVRFFALAKCVPKHNIDVQKQKK